MPSNVKLSTQNTAEQQQLNDLKDLTRQSSHISDITRGQLNPEQANRENAACTNERDRMVIAIKHDIHPDKYIDMVYGDMLPALQAKAQELATKNVSAEAILGCMKQLVEVACIQSEKPTIESATNFITTKMTDACKTVAGGKVHPLSHLEDGHGI